MSLPTTLYTMRLLILDTFRQARASGILWLMLAVNVITIALCLSVTVEGDVPLEAAGKEDRPELLPRSDLAQANLAVADVVAGGFSESLGAWKLPAPFFSGPYQQVAAAARHGVPVARGRLTLGFGAIPIDLARDRQQTVRSLECVLASWVADSVGLLLALMWTAGFLPAFLQSNTAAVLLAKPVPRWALLVGKYLGGIVFVAAMGLLFVGGTWLALGLRTGVWDATWFLCLPVLVLHFSVFYAFSALLAVVTRSTVVCVFGSIVFWLVCWGMNFGRHTLLAVPEFQGLPSVDLLSGLGYWVLPKPLDFHLLLVQALQVENVGGGIVDVARLTERGAWSPELSILTSLLAGAVLLAMAAYELSTTDY